jgi:hypothetical protein
MTSDIREELAEMIHNAAMDNPRGEAIFDEGTECSRLADAILASPLLRRIRAEAWDEGNAAGWNDGARANTVGLAAETPNPYREEEA